MANPPAVSAFTSLKNQSVVGLGKAFGDLSSNKTVNAVVRGTGAVTATVKIMGSNLPEDDTFIEIGSIDLSGTNLKVEGFVPESKWAYVRCDVTAITGTNAKVDAAFGANFGV